VPVGAVANGSAALTDGVPDGFDRPVGVGLLSIRLALEPDGVLTPFQLSPVLALLERHAPHRTAHASLIAGIRSLLAGTGLAPRPSLPGPLTGPLSGSEVRLLRYLPTNLSLPEIARELSVSPHTVKSHIRSLYAKPGAHRRSGAVETARAPRPARTRRRGAQAGQPAPP